MNFARLARTSRMLPLSSVLLAGTLLLSATPAQGQIDCLLDYTLTYTPLPENSTYGCGETVTFCLTVNSWNTTNSNWIHAVVPTFGPGWDLSTLTPGPPPATVGGSGGTWGWYNSVTPNSGVGVGTVGPGFFFDLDNDGNPGDNFGDYATTGPWTFCWTISVPDAPDCVNGADLTVTADVYGDSETGSWTSPGCGGDDVPSTPTDPPLTVAACPTAGIGYAIAFCNIDPPMALAPGLTGSPAPDGVWTTPDGIAFDGTVDPSAFPSGAYTYTVGASTDCPQTSAVVDVTVNIVPDAGQDTAIARCETDAPVDLFTMLSGTPDAGGYWTGPMGPMADGMLDPATALSGPYVYTVAGVAPCPTLSATVDVTIDHLPDPGTDAAFARCVEAPLVPLFSLLGSADTGGTWTGPDGQPTDDQFDPASDPPGAYTYTIAATAACTGHFVEAVVEATLFPVPDASFTVDTLRACVPFEAGFSLVTPDPVVAAHWYFGDGIFSDELPDLVHLYANTGTFSPRVTVTDQNGCTATWVDTNGVRAYPQPLSTFSYTPFPLRTYFETHAEFTATQAQLKSYEWAIEGLILFGRTVDHAFPLEPAAEYPVCLTVVDSIGCTTEHCESVIVHDAFSVNAPNAFTPNGDGKNDTFTPTLTGIDVRSLSFQVFDRWGQRIYDTAGPNPSWSGGKDNGGTVLPEGVYVWHLVVQDELTAEQRDFIGHVTLLH